MTGWKSVYVTWKLTHKGSLAWWTRKLPWMVGHKEVSKMEHRFLCKQCRHVFDLEMPRDSSLDKEVHCTKCGGSDVMEAPTWAPLGSGWNILESTVWEYECQQCKHVFKMPIPKSPAEDKSRRCPACNSGHLHLLTNMGGLPLHCG